MDIVTRSEILTALNSRLGRSETTTAAIEDYINAAVSDISNAGLWPCLHTSETTSISSGTSNIDVPDDMRVLDSIDLLSTSDVVLANLYEISWQQYREMQIDATSSEYSEPDYYVVRGNTIYLWPVSDSSYKVKVHYWKHHPEQDTLLYDARYREALYNGTMMHYLAGKGLQADGKYKEKGELFAMKLAQLANDMEMKQYCVEYHDEYSEI